MRKTTRKTRRTVARPRLSPEEERAVLEHLRHEQEMPYDGPKPTQIPTGFEEAPKRGSVPLSEALRQTAEAMRREASARYTLRAEATLNPDAYDFAVSEKATVRERTYPTLSGAVKAARALHEARPFGVHLWTTVSGPLGTIHVSQNGRLWGDPRHDVEYELRGESLAVVRVRGGAR